MASIATPAHDDRPTSELARVADVDADERPTDRLPIVEPSIPTPWYDRQPVVLAAGAVAAGLLLALVLGVWAVAQQSDSPQPAPSAPRTAPATSTATSLPAATSSPTTTTTTSAVVDPSVVAPPVTETSPQAPSETAETMSDLPSPPPAETPTETMPTDTPAADQPAVGEHWRRLLDRLRGQP